MASTIGIDVQWPDGRTVRVDCYGVIVLPPTVDRPFAPASVTLTGVDVESRATVLGFLADATRDRPDGGSVRLVGLEHNVRAMVRFLVDSPPPSVITVRVAP